MTTRAEGSPGRGRGSLRGLRVVVLALVLLVAGALLLVGAALTLARVTTPGGRWGVGLVAMVPWGVPAFVLALVGFGAAMWLGGGRPVRLPAVIALAGLVVQLVWLAPAYLGSHPAGPGNLTVMQLNMRYGVADPRATTALAERSGADVVALEEATPESAANLRAQGLQQRLPHRAGLVGEGKGGVEVLSRYPLTRVRRLGVIAGAFVMRVHAPRPFWLVVVHADQPFDDPGLWEHDLAVVRSVAAHLRGPRIVVGDLNATLGHAPVRRLLDTGLADAAQTSNSGWQPTWPGAEGGFPPLPRFGLVQIDHVLVGGGVAAVSTRTTEIPGTDHRAVVAHLVVGRGRPGSAPAGAVP